MRYEPGTVIDHYEIVERLGEGAYGASYMARDRRDDRCVVLKVPNPTLFADPSVYGRYRRETEIARQLHHPNMVASLDLAEHRTEPYLVLEYVEGDNFRHYLRSCGDRIDVETAIGWGRQLASVIEYLGDHGIVHRDLKPENIIIRPDRQLKVIDFGTALLEGARRLTWRHLSENLGTPDYMSPEQIQGERGDTRSDIYAWGVMMYEFLTGRVPFGGDNWMAAMAGHLTKTPERIRNANPAVPPALEAVVLKAMRRYPVHRYQSAAELLADLDRLDELDAKTFDLSPEPPMGGIAAVESGKRLALFALTVAGIFIAIAAAVIAIAVVVSK